MAGHSKWANIQHRKGRQDERRGKLFTRLIKEITVAAKLGGSDVSVNPRLRLAMDKASDANMPKDTVTKAVQRGSGQLDGVDYIEIRYEGYGIGGAAVIVDCLTDNRTRTVAEVRHAFAKYGGNLGTDGSVAFLFRHCGQFLFAPGTVTEDRLLEFALEAGADDWLCPDDGGVTRMGLRLRFATARAAGPLCLRCLTAFASRCLTTRCWTCRWRPEPGPGLSRAISEPSQTRQPHLTY